MRFLKKVSVTSNDTSGKIIDSFNTGDNHTVNAPSLNAVEERVQGCDNNLIFNADFLCQPHYSGSDRDLFALGWSSVSGRFTPAAGVIFNPLSSIELISPYILPSWFMTNNSFDFPLTVSFEVAIGEGDTSEINTYSLIYNDYTEVLSDRNIFEIADGVYLRGKFININNKGYGLAITSTAPIPSTSDVVVIRRIKAEIGSTATPFIHSMRDFAMLNSIQTLITNSVAGSVADLKVSVAGLKVFEFKGTLPTSLNGREDITADSGYNLSILAAYAYNRTDSKYYQMSMTSVVGAEYYRPHIYTFGNKARITLDSTSLNNYSGQAYKVFALGWKES